MARILVVDDEYDVRLALRKLLESAGYEVVEASTSEEAVERFREAPTDLVITDLFIPTEGGLAVIQKVIADQPDLNVVAMSGSAVGLMDETFAAARKQGAVQTFKKPFQTDEVLAMVKGLLDT